MIRPFVLSLLLFSVGLTHAQERVEFNRDIRPILTKHCTACHGVEIPHGSAFVADHPNHVYNSGSVCMKCHGNGGTGPQGCWGGQCHTGSIN